MSSVTFPIPRSRNISSAMRSVTSAQISTTLLYRSPSGDQAVLVLLFDLAHIVMSFLEQLFFARRNHHVFDGNGNPRLGRIFVTDIFQAIGENDRRLVAGQAIADVNQIRQLLFFITRLTSLNGITGGTTS